MTDRLAPWDDGFFQKGKTPSFSIYAFGEHRRFTLGDAFAKSLESLTRLQRFRLICQYVGDEAVPYILSYSGARDNGQGFCNGRTQTLYLPTMPRRLRHKAYAYLMHLAGMSSNPVLVDHLASVAYCISRNIVLPKFWTGEAWKITVPDFADYPQDPKLTAVCTFTNKV